MKACVLETPGDVRSHPLRWTDGYPQPVPGAGEVLVKVHCCAVCRTDLHVIEGELPSKKSPLIPGHQVVGTVVSAPDDGIKVGTRVGVAWLHRTCGACRFCKADRENLCGSAEFTGWARDGGYAQFITAPADFVYPLPSNLTDEQSAPLLCAGIIGYRCLQSTGLTDWSGRRLGLYGFGAAAHITIQIARHRGAEVYVFTRDQSRHRELAESLGAAWVGGNFDQPPRPLDAAIVFAPAGELVPAGLDALDRGGRLVLGGIHMSDIPPLHYDQLYWERSVHTVANNTRADGHEFLRAAAEAGVHTHTECFDLHKANEVLVALKHQSIRGAAVLMVPQE